MHELGVTRNVVAIVDEAAKGRRVGRVTLKIGKLSGVVSDAVAFCFDARIATCGFEFATETLFATCQCGSRRLTRLQGEEMNVKSMELMEAA